MRDSNNDVKEVKCLDLKFFTECLSDKEVVGYIGNEKPDITKAIEEAIEKMIKESEKDKDFVYLVDRNGIPRDIIEVNKDER